MNPYKWLWSHTTGRPYTYIWRDVYHTAPIVIQVLWFSIGGLIVYNFGWEGAGVFAIVYLFGFLEGHFHWGKKYIPGQEEKLLEEGYKAMNRKEE